MCVQCLIENLICISWWLITLNIFSCAYLPSCLSTLVKCLPKPFSRILIGGLFPSCWVPRGFHMLWIQVLREAHDLQIFPLSLWLLFILIVGSLTEHHIWVVTLLRLPAYPVLAECALALAPWPRAVHILVRRVFLFWWIPWKFLSGFCLHRQSCCLWKGCCIASC